MELLCAGFAIFVFGVFFLIARYFAMKNGGDDKEDRR
jgi:hypothetical protein